MTMPPARDGLIPTLNNQGFMTTSLDAYSEAFVDYAAASKLPVLEIGACYGIASLQVLAKGAKVIANDLCEEHLSILQQRCPIEQRTNLTLKPGKFPDEIKILDGSIGAVLICRVLHFFSGEDIERSLKKIHSWLAPGGKIFMVNETPYLKNWIRHLPIFEERKAKGEKWPSYITNLKEFTDTAHYLSLPDALNFMDLDTATNAVKEAGFDIDKGGYINRVEFPDSVRLDGRESVGIIASKPPL